MVPFCKWGNDCMQVSCCRIDPPLCSPHCTWRTGRHRPIHTFLVRNSSCCCFVGVESRLLEISATLTIRGELQLVFQMMAAYFLFFLILLATSYPYVNPLRQAKSLNNSSIVRCRRLFVEQSVGFRQMSVVLVGFCLLTQQIVKWSLVEMKSLCFFLHAYKLLTVLCKNKNTCCCLS